MQPVILQLDKQRTAKLTLGGMKAFEEKTGKSLLKGFEITELNAGDIIALIWCCLIWEDPALTLEKVGFLLDMETANKVFAAFTASGESANPTMRPPGSNSGQ